MGLNDESQEQTDTYYIHIFDIYLLYIQQVPVLFYTFYFLISHSWFELVSFLNILIC